MDDNGTNLGHAEVVRSTEKALLVKLEDEDEPRWIPKSVIHDNSEVYSMRSPEGTLVVQTWWAKANGFA